MSINETENFIDNVLRDMLDLLEESENWYQGYKREKATYNIYSALDTAHARRYFVDIEHDDGTTDTIRATGWVRLTEIRDLFAEAHGWEDDLNGYNSFSLSNWNDHGIYGDVHNPRTHANVIEFIEKAIVLNSKKKRENLDSTDAKDLINLGGN